MVIMGAGGHALEILDILVDHPNLYKNIFFFDNVTHADKRKVTLKEFPFIDTFEALEEHFKNNGNKFIVGVGGIKSRTFLQQSALQRGGSPYSLISNNAILSRNAVLLQPGVQIMQLAFISSHVTIGEGTLINTRANIHHETSIGSFCEIAPNATILGNCKIGNNVLIGANSTILPNISIGDNSTVGAGSTVTKNIPVNEVWMGTAAKCKFTGIKDV